MGPASPPSVGSGSDTTGVRWPRPSRLTSARSTPTWMVCTHHHRPRVVQALLDTITFEEMLEMASLGSKGGADPAVEFAGKYKVKLRVLSSFQEEGGGTLITVGKTRVWNNRSSPALPSTVTKPRSPCWAYPASPVSPTDPQPGSGRECRCGHDHQNVGYDGTTGFSFTVNRPTTRPSRSSKA